MVEVLWYKLRPSGVKLYGSAEVYCDKNSVVRKSSVTASVLNKINNAICYHRVREAQDVGTLRIGWIPGEYNISYLLTKTKMIGNMRHGMVELIFYNEAVVRRDKD